MRKSIYFILLLYTSVTLAQNPEWANYTNGDYILQVAENNGYIWAATFGGLMKYNPATEEKEFFNKGSTLFPSNGIQCIAFINEDTYWVGTAGGLVYVSNSSWTVYDTSNSELPDNLVKSIAIDNEGIIWIGTGDGLVKYDGIGWTIYNTSNSQLPNDFINVIKVASNNTVWVGTNQGIAEIDGNNWSVYTSLNSGIQNDLISSIAIEDTNLVWAGAYLIYSSLPSVYLFDGNDWTSIGAPNLAVFGIDIDSQGNKYVAMNIFDPPYGQGLYFIPSGTTSINFLFADTLSSGWVSSILVDDNDIIWLGTSHGLLKYNGTFYDYINTSNSGFTKNNINQVFIDVDQNKWFCSTGWIPLSSDQFQVGSVSKFDDNNWQTFSYKNSIVAMEGVRCLAGDNSGLIYAASDFGFSQYPLIMYDGYNWYPVDVPQTQYDQINYMYYDGDLLWVYFEGGYFYTYQYGLWSQINNFPGNYVNTILRVGDIHWVGSGDGLYKLEAGNWSVYDTSNSGLPNNKVTSLAIDSQTNLWIATYGGLAKFDGTNWEVYNSSNAPITNEHLSTVAVDHNGIIYIGSLSYYAHPNQIFGDGLVKKLGNQWTIFNSNNSGFPSTTYHLYGPHFISKEYNNIYSLAIDSTNKVWIATDGGVGVYDKDGIPVPVELLSFSALITNNSVTLKWETASETNNLGFEVQRKVTGMKSNWEKIGFVEGKGTTTEKQSYSFEDPFFNATKLFYRLKQFDFNGSFSYSYIVEVQLVMKPTFQLGQNYPNPFNPATTINYSIPNASKVSLIIYDLLGRKIKTLVNESQKPGRYEIQFNASSFVSGVYFYQLRTDNFINTKKMILLR